MTDPTDPQTPPQKPLRPRTGPLLAEPVDPSQPPRPRSGPVLIDLTDTPEPARETPATAAPVPDAEAVETGTMATLALIAARPASPLSRWFFSLGGAVLTTLLTVGAVALVRQLMEQSVIFGSFVLALFGAFAFVCLIIVVREIAALSRLGQIEKIRIAAEEVIARGDLAAGRALATRLSAFYAGRPDLKWTADGLDKAAAESFDADGVIAHAERALLGPLDAQAVREVEAAARQVATVTALVPLALADLIAALIANLRMIRRIAEIYGGRAGTLGSWRLTKAVMTHLVATGAIALGDDMLGSIAGGGLMSRVSRRFGEGVVNGALTARVGVAAIEVCRPLPYLVLPRPSVGGIVQRALSGLFTAERGAPVPPDARP